MLTTPWLSSSQISSWTEFMEYPVCAVLSTVHCYGCYLLFSDPQQSQSRRVSEKRGKLFSCLISSVSTAAIPKILTMHFWVPGIPSFEVSCAKDAWGLWASLIGVVLPFIFSHALSTFQYSQLLGSPWHPRKRWILSPHILMASEYVLCWCELKPYTPACLMYQGTGYTQSNRSDCPFLHLAGALVLVIVHVAHFL